MGSERTIHPQFSFCHCKLEEYPGNSTDKISIPLYLHIIKRQVLFPPQILFRQCKIWLVASETKPVRMRTPGSEVTGSKDFSEPLCSESETLDIFPLSSLVLM